LSLSLNSLLKKKYWELGDCGKMRYRKRIAFASIGLLCHVLAFGVLSGLITLVALVGFAHFGDFGLMLMLRSFDCFQMLSSKTSPSTGSSSSSGTGNNNQSHHRAKSSPDPVSMQKALSTAEEGMRNFRI